MAKSTALCVVVVVVALGCLGCCWGQINIRWLNIRSDIRYRFATTLVTGRYLNDHAHAQEAVFEVTLPKEAFISNFSMIIGDKEYVGEVKEKRKAKYQYHAARSQGHSAGYVSNRARHSNMFNINVNVAAGTGVEFHLTYQQLLVRSHGYYEHKIHVDLRQKIGALKIEVYIEENRDITYLSTPGLASDVLTDFDITGGAYITVSRPTPTSAYIVYEPSPDALSNSHNKQLITRYDVSRTSSAGEVLVVDGYFVHFFAPQTKTLLKPIPKDIIFMLDVSGSMTSGKLAQVKEAMNMILDELGNGDRFSILLFDDRIRMWKDQMVPVNKDYTMEAKQFVNRMEAEGLTDIHGAFHKGLQFLLSDQDPGHVPIVFFLTDGKPTSGVTQSAAILSAVRKLNNGKSAIFSLAFGHDADYNLLKSISAQNDGFARKIYEASDASKQVQGFYKEISTTLLTGVKIKYLNSTIDPESLTKTDFKNLFNGSEIVVSGKIANEVGVVDDVGITITGTGYRGRVVLVMPNSTLQDLVVDDVVPTDFPSIIEKSWAYLTIKELLQNKLQTTSEVVTANIDKRVLELSLKYNFVTPLTAMVATKPEQTEPTALRVEEDDYAPTKNVRSFYGSPKRRLSPSWKPDPSTSDGIAHSAVNRGGPSGRYNAGAPVGVSGVRRRAHYWTAPLTVNPLFEAMPFLFLTQHPPKRTTITPPTQSISTTASPTTVKHTGVISPSTKLAGTILSSAKSTHNVTSSVKSTDNMTSSAKSTDIVTSSAKSTINVTASAKSISNVTSSAKPTYNVTASAKLTNNVTSSAKPTPELYNSNGKRKNRKHHKIRKGRKCRNERIANLEGVAVGVANRNESVLCSKVIGRVRSGGFNVLPDIFGGPQVVILFSKRRARFINGFEKIVVTSSGLTLEVDVRSANTQSTSQRSAPPCEVKVTNSHKSRLTITCPDISVVMFKRRTEHKRKCFNNYYMSIQVDEKRTETGKEVLDVWHLIRKGKALKRNGRLALKRNGGLAPNSVCDGLKVKQIKLKKPNAQEVSEADYFINF